MNDIEFDDNKSIWPFLKRIFKYSYIHEKKLIFQILFFAGIVGVVDSLYPYLFSEFINSCLVHSISDSKLTISEIFFSPCIQKFFLYLIILCIILSISVMFFVYAAGTIGERIIFKMRKDLFEKLQQLPFSFYDKNSTGWLLSRISSDTDRVSEVISWGLIGIAWAFVSIIFCFSIMFYMHWKLTLIVLSSLPIMFFISIKIRKLILKYSRLSRKINSEMIGLINEHIQGVELNKVLGNEDKAVSIFSKKAVEHRKSSFKSQYYSATYFPVVIIIGNIAAAFVLCYGSFDIIDKSLLLSLGVLSSFFIYAIQIFEPISDITNYYSIAQNCLSAGERIFSLIDEPIEDLDNSSLAKFESIKGDIKLINIDFGYNEDKKILSNFSLSIPAGQQVAIVGPTGGGKTTISSLIARFYYPDSGDFLIDNINVMSRTMSSFRSQVGIVLQQPHVFSGTIGENVRFGLTNLTNKKIENIFKSMGCDDLASRVEEIIQPDGINLSVGEKQLIALARVFAYDPKILILDEATSAIDTITEQKLKFAIQSVMKNRTSIVIAHRLSTIVECDRILYIQNGEIMEDGTHQELMNNKSKYWNLHMGN